MEAETDMLSGTVTVTVGIYSVPSVGGAVPTTAAVTVILKSAVATFPAASVAVQVSVLVPLGNTFDWVKLAENSLDVFHPFG